jgi:hypothetical protein
MCSLKTMLKVAAAMFAVIGIAYFALPDARTWMIAALPTLSFLICPISMLLCMKMMNGQNGKSCPTSQPEAKSESSVTNGGIESKGV